MNSNDGDDENLSKNEHWFTWNNSCKVTSTPSSQDLKSQRTLRSRPSCSPPDSSRKRGRKRENCSLPISRSESILLLNKKPFVLQQIFSYFISCSGVDQDVFRAIMDVCHAWREIAGSTDLWGDVPWELNGKGLNWARIQVLDHKITGTEGTCFRCFDRATGKELALKKARVYPYGEGIPYYMLREIAALRDLQHPNISRLRHVSLHNYQLRILFDFVPKTLLDYTGGIGNRYTTESRPIPLDHIRPLMKQLLLGVSACHRIGILHRNLKPKHLLIFPKEGEEGLDGARLFLSDFALVRLTCYPRRSYTSEVVTLWYRPPELLLGSTNYTMAVDMWSVGCIFAEMVVGHPFFTGTTEVDQLFQIFSRLSTPTPKTWPELQEFPNYSFPFPNWKERILSKFFPTLGHLGLDLMDRLFTYDPKYRITADEALRHPYLSGVTIPMSVSDQSCYRYFSDDNANNNSVTSLLYGVNMSSVLKPPARLQIPTSCTEGMIRYLAYLHHEESIALNTRTYNNALGPEHRAMLVDWLLEVVDVFDMCQRTIFLAMMHMDRYISLVSVCIRKYQLLGATCLHMASKCEDVSYIYVMDLTLCADKVYSPTDVLDMEEKVLNALDFRLALPTTIDFLNVALEISPDLVEKCGEKLKHISHYLAEIYLQDATLIALDHSAMGTACIVLGMAILGEYPVWGPGLARVSKVEVPGGIRFEIEKLHAVHLAYEGSALKIIRRRYSKVERGNVSSLPCLSYLHIDWNTGSYEIKLRTN